MMSAAAVRGQLVQAKLTQGSNWALGSIQSKTFWKRHFSRLLLVPACKLLLLCADPLTLLTSLLVPVGPSQVLRPPRPPLGKPKASVWAAAPFYRWGQVKLPAFRFERQTSKENKPSLILFQCVLKVLESSYHRNLITCLRIGRFV